MVKPLISDEELKVLEERYEVTKEEKWVKDRKYLFSSLDTLTNNTLALIQVLSTVRLEESSKRLEESSLRLERSSRRLNCLTWALVGLTVALAILTGVLVCRSFH